MPLPEGEGVTSLQQGGYSPVLLVGRSFGGAAGALHPHVAGVVALAPQTYGAHLAGQLALRPLLVVHGKPTPGSHTPAGVQIYDWAQEPKHLIL